jgi:hypothetical protein
VRVLTAHKTHLDGKRGSIAGKTAEIWQQNMPFYFGKMILNSFKIPPQGNMQPYRQVFKMAYRLIVNAACFAQWMCSIH